MSRIQREYRLNKGGKSLHPQSVTLTAISVSVRRSSIESALKNKRQAYVRAENHKRKQPPFAPKRAKMAKKCATQLDRMDEIPPKCATESVLKGDNCSSFFNAVAQKSQTSCPFRRPDTDRVQPVCNRCATQAILSYSKLIQGKLRRLKKAL